MKTTLPKTKKRKPAGRTASLRSGTLVRRSGWTPVNRKRLPKSGIIIGGSWRADGAGGLEWSMSSPCSNGWDSWFDDDRTHYMRLPTPPNTKGSRAEERE